MDNQRTIKDQASVTGIGLHTAHKATVTFKPAAVDSGITFVRTDLAPKPAVKAVFEKLIPFSQRSPRRTAIGYDKIQIQTIEHLMAALGGLAIDNIIVEIDNDEVPGMDGSGLKFSEAILKAGIELQDKEKRYFTVNQPISVEENGASICVIPGETLRVSYTLDYQSPGLKTQYLDVVVNPETFTADLAAARTFCLEEEADQLQRQGLGKGANHENTLVVGKSGVIRNSLRYEDEFIRHKILDLIGDLYLLGQPVKGHIVAVKSGHSLNQQLVRKMIGMKHRGQDLSSKPLDLALPQGGYLNVENIMRILPHREPFLFVDRITALEVGRRATGIKNVTINDYFFKGHFPGKPVMPGVLILEAMAQVGGVMMLAPEENRGKLAYFIAIDNVKFRKTVVPGDQLVLQVEAIRVKSKTGQVHASASVDGKVVTEADMMFALVDV